jgi:hypothetical protein
MVLGLLFVNKIELKVHDVSEMAIPSGPSNRTPFVSTMRSTKAPDKLALFDSHNDEF